MPLPAPVMTTTRPSHNPLMHSSEVLAAEQSVGGTLVAAAGWQARYSNRLISSMNTTTSSPGRMHEVRTF
jgi:hypothetical protein